MTDEEILKKAEKFATDNAVTIYLGDNWTEEQRDEAELCYYYSYNYSKSGYIAGYEQAKKDLSCVQQRLNMLEEHNMTIDDVIASLEKHNEIHSRQEPRAYYITKALNIAVDSLKLISELKNAYSRFGDACNNDEETKYWYEICALLEKIK